MYDELPEALINDYVGAMQKQIPRQTSVASGDANAIWIAYNDFMTAMLAKDKTEMERIANVMKGGWFKFITGNDGFHEDGSYIMHTYYPYTGGYGASAVETLAKWTYLVDGTDLDFSEANKDMMYTWIKDAYAPFIYKGLITASVQGRDMSRQTESDHVIGQTVIRSIYLIGRSLGGEREDELNGLVKYWAQEDDYKSIYSGIHVTNDNNTIFYADRIKKMTEDGSVPVADMPTGVNVFPRMNRAFATKDGYGFSISMYSNRTRSYESINAENLRGWHTADGMTYLYNDDLGQFSKDYWPTVDSNRLPGTTVNSQTSVSSRANLSSYAGGAVLDGSYGAVGMISR
jgi:hyaluronate lyase